MRNLLCLALLFLAFTAYSQENDSINKLHFGTYFSVYTLNPKALTDLNQQLKAADRLDLNDNIVGISFGFTQRFANQNSYMATKLNFFSATDMEDSDDHTRLRVWEFSTTSHYDLLPNQNWLAYPLLGLGLNVAQLNLLQQTPANFQNSLAIAGSGVQRQKYTTDLMLFADLGVGAERALRFPEASLFLGVSGGYRFSFSEPWNIDNLRYFTETEFSTQGWFFEIKFRSEIADPEKSNASRGLFQFFQ